MKQLFNKRNILVLLLLVAVCALAYYVQPANEIDSVSTHRWYSVLPPLLAVSLAVISGRILLSLFSAVLIAGLLAVVPGDPLSIASWGKGLITGVGLIRTSIWDEWNVQLLAFIVFTLSMISVVIVSGGLHGVVLWLNRYARSARSAQMVTYLMGFVIFIDDYSNTMIVGTAMRPVTDRMRVSREKLAFIVDSTSAPVAGIALISTWVGYEVGQMVGVAETLNIELNGYALLFNALPFRFYCVLMLVFVFATIVFNRDFGPMAKAQERADIEGKVEADDAVPMTSNTFSHAEPHTDARISAWSAILPLGFLIVFLIGGIWVDGGGLAVMSERFISVFSFYAWRDVISASEDSVKILATGSGISLIVSMVCARLIAGSGIRVIRDGVKQGVQSSLLPMVILVLAWSLKAACDELGTGPFLVAAVGDSINPAVFPAIVFVVAGMTSFATGTSYGTMAILMPTAVPIAFALEGNSYGLITMITFGAILDGSIFGDHCSPISDTTIMSSISSSSDHMHHVRTQFPYSLTVGVLALVCGYLPAGFGMPSWLGIVLATAAITGLFALLSMRKTNRVPLSEAS